MGAACTHPSLPLVVHFPERDVCFPFASALSLGRAGGEKGSGHPTTLTQSDPCHGPVLTCSGDSFSTAACSTGSLERVQSGKKGGACLALPLNKKGTGTKAKWKSRDLLFKGVEREGLEREEKSRTTNFSYMVPRKW